MHLIWSPAYHQNLFRWVSMVMFVFCQLVDEFLGSQRVAMAPQTFHMGSLLQEMREIEESEVKFVPQRGGYHFICYVVVCGDVPVLNTHLSHDLWFGSAET